jgi:hypothetical protein
LGVATLFLAVGDGRASSLIIHVEDSFGTMYDIIDQLPPDTNPGLNAIQADTTTLIFPNFDLKSLSATSNNPGQADPKGAFVQVQATVQAITPVADTLTITAYQTNFSLPTGPSFNLVNTSTTNYVNVPAGSQTAEAWYNPASPAVPPPPFGTPAPLVALALAGTNSTSGTTMLTGLPPSTDFSLTTQMVINLGGVVGAQDTGSSIAQLHAIPEPSSVIMLGTAAPLALVLLSKIRRVRKRASA